MIPDLRKIKSSSLLVNGRYDSTADIAVPPFHDRIPNVTWVKLENSSRMGHFEQKERYIEVLRVFLRSENLKLASSVYYRGIL